MHGVFAGTAVDTVNRILAVASPEFCLLNENTPPPQVPGVTVGELAFSKVNFGSVKVM